MRQEEPVKDESFGVSKENEVARLVKDHSFDVT